MDTQPESPEVTGIYLCSCGNASEFTGIDTYGFPGDDCDCGEDPCICQVVLKQDFTVLEQGPDGAINYQVFMGGGNNAEIGMYTEVLCRACGSCIWRLKPEVES